MSTILLILVILYAISLSFYIPLEDQYRLFGLLYLFHPPKNILQFFFKQYSRTNQSKQIKIADEHHVILMEFVYFYRKISIKFMCLNILYHHRNCNKQRFIFIQTFVLRDDWIFAYNWEQYTKNPLMVNSHIIFILCICFWVREW